MTIMNKSNLQKGFSIMAIFWAIAAFLGFAHVASNINATSSVQVSTTTSIVQVQKNSSESSINIVSPNGGESFTLVSSDTNAAIPVKISFKNIQGLSIYLLDSSGNTVASMATDNRDNGTSIQFYINQNKNVSVIQPGQYKIKVCDIANARCASSASYFSITSPVSKPSIKVISPNGGETIKQGQTYNITWTSTGINSAANMSIELQDDSKYCPPGYVGCWTSFGIGGGPNTGSYSWDTNAKMFGDGGPNSVSPAMLSADTKFRIKICEQGIDICDFSDSDFTVASTTRNIDQGIEGTVNLFGCGTVQINNSNCDTRPTHLANAAVTIKATAVNSYGATYPIDTIATTSSDQNGNFIVSLQPGNYIVCSGSTCSDVTNVKAGVFASIFVDVSAQ